MNIDLSGKVAIVTGSTTGIGRAAAKGLAQCGAAVVVNGRTQAAVDQTIAAIKAQIPGAILLGAPADLSTSAGCAALAEAAPVADILVNNVAMFAMKDFFDIPDSEWTDFFELNVMSGVRLSRAYAPGMVERKWGRIIFISSESGLNIPPEMIHYGFSKTANLSISRGLAKRLAGTGVTVNAVLPGPTMTDNARALLTAAAQQSGAALEDLVHGFMTSGRPSSIIRRFADPEEVANMIVYAASPQASATTGAALRVDGGIVDTIA